MVPYSHILWSSLQGMAADWERGMALLAGLLTEA